MEILKEGKKYVAICETCGCRFTYKHSDVYEQINFTPQGIKREEYIECPECRTKSFDITYEEYISENEENRMSAEKLTAHAKAIKDYCKSMEHCNDCTFANTKNNFSKCRLYRYTIPSGWEV